MMKKRVFLILNIIFLALCPQAQAGFWDTKPKAKAPVKAAPVKTVVDSGAVNKRSEARIKESLAAKDWEVYFTSIDGKKNVMDSDVLVFSEGRFTSKNLAGKGYSTSNFTITISENGRVEWETLQVVENGDMAAWKGQIEADVMSGILSIHTLNGRLEDFYFTSVSK